MHYISKVINIQVSKCVSVFSDAVPSCTVSTGSGSYIFIHILVQLSVTNIIHAENEPDFPFSEHFLLNQPISYKLSPDKNVSDSSGELPSPQGEGC